MADRTVALGEAPASPPSPRTRAGAFFVPFFLLGLLAGHAYLLGRHFVPAYASPDADGYFAQARLLVEQGRVTFRPESPLQYIPMHWLELPDGRFISRYPPGLPVLLAAAWALGGREAALLVNPVLAVLTLLILFLFVRDFAGPWLALLAVVVFATTPLANRHALHADSHTAAAFFLLGGLYFLWRWSRGGRRLPGFFGGFLLGYLPSVRHAEAAAAVGVIVFLLLQGGRFRGRRRALLWPVLGALPPVLAELAFNQIQFGAFWRTAYSLTHEQQLSWALLQANAEPFLAALLSRGVGLFLGLGLAGSVAMLATRGLRPAGFLFLLVPWGVAAVYAAYYFSAGSERGWFRFLLPTLPLFLVPAFWLLSRLRRPGLAAAAALALTAVHTARGLPRSLAELAAEQERARRSAAALAFLEQHVPSGSLLIGERRLHEQIHWTGRWRLVDARVVAGERGLERFFAPPRLRRSRPNRFRNRPWARRAAERPSPLQRGKAEALRARYAGLDPEARAVRVGADLRAWAEKGAVFWCTRGTGVRRFLRQASGWRAEEVARLRLPAPPPAPRLRLPGAFPFRRRPRRPLGDFFALPAGATLRLYRLE